MKTRARKRKRQQPEHFHIVFRSVPFAGSFVPLVLCAEEGGGAFKVYMLSFPFSFSLSRSSQRASAAVDGCCRALAWAGAAFDTARAHAIDGMGAVASYLNSGPSFFDVGML